VEQSATGDAKKMGDAVLGLFMRHNSRIQAKISSMNTDFVITHGEKTLQLQALHVMVKKTFKNHGSSCTVNGGSGGWGCKTQAAQHQPSCQWMIIIWQ
jgi:hypothetical protein